MIKIHITSFPELDGFGFYILRYEECKKYIARVDKDSRIEWVLLEGTAEKIKPTFFTSDLWSEEFMQAFAEALDKKNIKTDKDAKIQGTLEAQRYHLEDLRILLKLDK